MQYRHSLAGGTVHQYFKKQGQKNRKDLPAPAAVHSESQRRQVIPVVSQRFSFKTGKENSVTLRSILRLRAIQPR